MLFVCCAWIEERNPRVGLVACDICSYRLHHHYLSHIAGLPPIFPRGHLPVVSSPKVSSPFFFNSCFPSLFSSWPCFWPAGDIQKHKGSQRILPTKRSEWPKALLLSWYYDLTFVCLFADRWLLKTSNFPPSSLMPQACEWVCKSLV